MSVSEAIRKAERLSDAKKPKESNSQIGDVIWENNTPEEDAILFVLIGRNYSAMNKPEMSSWFLWRAMMAKDASEEIRTIAYKMWMGYGKPILNPTISPTGDL